MSAIAATTARPASPIDVLALQYANRYRMIGLPLIILSAVVVLTVGIGVAILRAGGTVHGEDANGSVLWSILGYMVALGVQATAVSFPFTLALGSTRRTFVLGALLGAVLQAALIAAAAVVLLGLEFVTRGWFIGMKVLASAPLGHGSPLLLAGVLFLGALTALMVGGVFGASWVRFGTWGPLGLATGVLLAGVLAVLLLGRAASTAADVFGPSRVGWIGSAVIGLSVVGEYCFLRRASVR